MHQPLFVRRIDGGTHAAHDFHCARDRQLPVARHRVTQVGAEKELHHEKGAGPGGDADIVHGDDVGMRERGRGARLALEALGRLCTADQLLAHDLGGHAALERGIGRLIHRAHATLPEPPVEPVPISEQA